MAAAVGRAEGRGKGPRARAEARAGPMERDDIGNFAADMLAPPLLVWKWNVEFPFYRSAYWTCVIAIHHYYEC